MLDDFKFSDLGFREVFMSQLIVFFELGSVEEVLKL